MKNSNNIILNCVAVFTIIQVCQSFPHKELSKNDLDGTFSISLPLHELEKKENLQLEQNQDDLVYDVSPTSKEIEKYDRLLEKIVKESKKEEVSDHYMKHVQSAPDHELMPAVDVWFKRAFTEFVNDEDYSTTENQDNAGSNHLENSSIDKSVKQEEEYEYEDITKKYMPLPFDSDYYNYDNLWPEDIFEK